MTGTLASRAASTTSLAFATAFAAGWTSTPARSSMPPTLAKAFCMSTSRTAVCSRSISMGSGRADRAIFTIARSSHGELKIPSPSGGGQGAGAAGAPRRGYQRPPREQSLLPVAAPSRPHLGRLRATAPHHERRDHGRPAGESAVWHKPHLPHRSLQPAAPDVGHERHDAAALARHPRVLGLVGPDLGRPHLPVGWPAAARPRLLRLFLRPVHRFLVRLLRRRAPGRARHSRWRNDDRAATADHARVRRNRPLLDADLCDPHG